MSRRHERYAARSVLWQVSDLRRVAYCGRFTTDTDGGVQVRVSGSVSDGTRRAGLAGVQSCGSTWACPVCSEKIQAERQGEVSTALAAWTAVPGREVVFLTLTMRHHAGQSLADLWAGLSAAWRATTSGSGRHWKADRQEFGVSHYLRVVEVTHGVNGWHVHVHALLFLDRSEQGPVTDWELAALRARLFGRWSRALVREGFSAWERVGIDVRRVHSGDALGEYFAKGTYRATSPAAAAFEVTGSVSKKAGGGRTPFQILASVISPSDVDRVEADLMLWREWEKASKGRRQLVRSRGLRAAVGLGAESTDQEVVDEDQGGDTLHDLGASWTALSLARKAARLLDAAEADDTGAALAAFLRGALEASKVGRWLDQYAPL